MVHENSYLDNADYKKGCFLSAFEDLDEDNRSQAEHTAGHACMELCGVESCALSADTILDFALLYGDDFRKFYKESEGDFDCSPFVQSMLEREKLAREEQRQKQLVREAKKEAQRKKKDSEEMQRLIEKWLPASDPKALEDHDSINESEKPYKITKVELQRIEDRFDLHKLHRSSSWSEFFCQETGHPWEETEVVD